MFIFIILIVYSKIKTAIDLDIINLEKYGTTETNSSDAGICLHIKELDNNIKSYLDFQSYNGIMNKTLKYEFLNNTCYTNYTYDPDNTSLFSLYPINSNLYQNEFTYEYQFIKQPNSNYLFFVYTQYNGTKLNIAHSKLKSTIILIIVLGALVGFIVILIIFCFFYYKCSKRLNKTKIDEQYMPMF